MKKIVFISTSLSPKSKSSLLIDYAISLIDTNLYEVEYIDLKSFDVPFCDGRDLNNYGTEIQDLYLKITNSDFLVFGFPMSCKSADILETRVGDTLSRTTIVCSYTSL